VRRRPDGVGGRYGRSPRTRRRHRRGTLLGKRYADGDTGLELLCTKAGEGSLSLGGTPLALKEAKPLPSSD